MICQFCQRTYTTEEFLQLPNPRLDREAGLEFRECTCRPEGQRNTISQEIRWWRAFEFRATPPQPFCTMFYWDHVGPNVPIQIQVEECRRDDGTSIFAARLVEPSVAFAGDRYRSNFEQAVDDLQTRLTGRIRRVRLDLANLEQLESYLDQ